MGKRLFRVGDIEGKFICICADNKTAVFAPFTRKKDKTVSRIKYKNMYAKSNYLV